MKLLLLNIKILVILLGTFFGAYSGSEGTSKQWRRFGIPIIIMIYAYFSLNNLWVITIMFMAFVLSIGYGIPNFDCEGGQIAQFFYKYFPYNIDNINDKKRNIVNILSRGVISLLLSLCLISIPIVKGNWMLYIMTILTNTSVFAFFSWKDSGYFIPNKLNKKLLLSDIYVYLVLMFNSINILN